MSPIFFQVILQNHSKIDTQIEFAMIDLFELFHQPIPNFNRIRHEQEWMEEEITLSYLSRWKWRFCFTTNL